MSAAKLTIRLDSAQFRTLNRLAQQQGIPRYRMLSKIIKSGFSETLGRRILGGELTEITTEIADLSVRLMRLERMLDRTLFTACAAYSYARHSALGMKRDDTAISADALAAFERQRSLAEQKS